MTGERGLHVICSGDAVATLRWLHPDATRLWRVNDVTRRTYYREANLGRDVMAQIVYRSFGPTYRTQSLESLLVISEGKPEKWSVSTSAVTPETASLTLRGPEETVWEIALARQARSVSVRNVG